MSTVNNVKIIELPKFLDARGNLSFVEQLNHIPFEIKRTYWIYDVPGGENRGGHAFMQNEEFIVALSGAFDVIVDDGENKKERHDKCGVTSYSCGFLFLTVLLLFFIVFEVS